MASAAATLAERLRLRFTDLRLLEQALVHSSYTNERPDAGQSNERLEFLGDAVIGLVVSEALWRQHPDEDEGSLTTRRASIVSAQGLARISQRLELGSYLSMGQGADVAGERRRSSVLAGALEAVTGAIYLQFGLQRTRAWLLLVFEPELAAEPPVATLKPPKSELQELSYARQGRPPHYRLLSTEGPEHDRHFVVEVELAGRALGRGEGRNRRDAETEAARQALAVLAREAERA